MEQREIKIDFNIFQDGDYSSQRNLCCVTSAAFILKTAYWICEMVKSGGDHGLPMAVGSGAIAVLSAAGAVFYEYKNRSLSGHGDAAGACDENVSGDEVLAHD